MAEQQRFKELNFPSGEVRKIQFRQYIMNERQQFAVLGLDNDELGGIAEIEEVPGMKYTPLGKLNEQGFILESQICNSLRRDQWDFAKDPNPEILLMERIS